MLYLEQLLKKAYQEVSSTPTYIATVNLYFESVEKLQSSFGSNAETIMADVPNYKNIEPVRQNSEVIV